MRLPESVGSGDKAIYMMMPYSPVTRGLNLVLTDRAMQTVQLFIALVPAGKARCTAHFLMLR